MRRAVESIRSLRFMGVILLMLLKLFLRYDPLESGQLNLTRAGGVSAVGR